ncbi:MAG: tripartite tricarboxylate transporter TctB family protein [Castellaniella sp.]|uniref:tripartite tricarboxylate transporter TctB family protein n=1 Tax=Castellaniella sp. TaxID=1955812 RepID=UPI003A88DC02
MDRIKKRELVVGFIMLASGLGYMLLSSQIEHIQNQYGFVDASFIPYVLSTLMILLGILQLLAVRKLDTREAIESAESAETRTDYLTVFKTIGLIVAYIALLEPVGFLLMTIAYLVIQFIVLTPSDKKPGIPGYVLIAVLTTVVIYALFRYAFDMVLPVGVLGL